MIKGVEKLYLIWILFFLLAFPDTIRALQAEPPSSRIDALIVTGQNSHNWPESSRILKQILEHTGLFRIDVSVSPPEGDSLRAFSPDFKSYQLVILDYCGDAWPSRIQKAFVEYVKGGGGVVVYHNSGDAFPDWPEYIQIIGLGGGNRTLESGPFVYWEKDGLVEDRSEGSSGYRGYSREFSVEIRDAAHPITAGLSLRWMHAEDELYSLLRGSAANLQILATAHSDIQKSGSGRDEPVMFINTYGDGRIFHTTLGHAEEEGPFPALECAGFIVTFQRGAEWAATGKVTQSVPLDFPALVSEIPAPDDVLRWPGYMPPSLEEILDDLAFYEYGQDEEILSRLREFVLSHKDSTESRILCEEQLAFFLESDASLAGKMAVCRHLRLIGTKRSVPVLERLLLQEETNDMSRFALEKIPGIEAENALIRSLSRLGNAQKLGSIASLGQRRSALAVPELALKLEESDSDIQAASAKALGQIAGPEAIRILLSALGESQGDLSSLLASALLNCAEKLNDQGDFEEAASIYRRFSENQFPTPIQVAAWRGLISSDKGQSEAIVLDLLSHPEPAIQAAAIDKINEVFDEKSIQSVISGFFQLPTKSQAALLHVFSGFPKKNVLPTVMKSTESEDDWVQISALEVLQKIGDASIVPFLARYASRNQGKVRQTARESLWNLNGPHVDQSVLLLLIKNTEPSINSELVRCVGERRIVAGKYILFDMISNSDDPRLRLEASRNLQILADSSDLPILLDLLINSREEAERMELRQAVISASLQMPIRNSRATVVKERLDKENDERAKGELIRVLGGIGDSGSLVLIRSVLNKPDSPIYDSAVRALVDWPDASVREDLLWVAQTAKNPVHRTLALRSGLQMMGRDRFYRPASAVEFLQRGLSLAERDDEIKLVLSLLPRFPCPESLQLARSLLSRETVQEEARLALHRILYDLLKNEYHVFR